MTKRTHFYEKCHAAEGFVVARLLAIIMHMAKQRWQHIDSPSSIFSIARAGDVGWVLGTSEGVWKYVNDTCSIVAETLRPAQITTVAASSGFPLHPVALCGAADGIAMTSDEGLTWQGAKMPQLAQISHLVVSPEFPFDRIAFAATMQDGVLCSTDFGASWQAWNYGLLDLETIALAVSPAFAHDETVVVATVRGLFRSTNAGRAWRELQFPPDALPVSSLIFAAGLLIVGSETQGMFYSADVGNNWGKRSSFKSGQISALAANSSEKVIAVATPAVVAKSSDHGANWVRAEGHVPQGIISIGIGDDDTLLAGTQADGLWLYA
jgi:photosystem II stability/assembly factor-like uncharacterized protein